MVSSRKWGKRGTGLQAARSGSRVGFAGWVRGSSAAQAAASVASRGGAADEDRISRGVEAGRSVPGGVYGRMFGACGSRIVRNRAVSPRVQRFRGFRRFPD